MIHVVTGKTGRQGAGVGVWGGWRPAFNLLDLQDSLQLPGTSNSQLCKLYGRYSSATAQTVPITLRSASAIDFLVIANMITNCPAQCYPREWNPLLKNIRSKAGKTAQWLRTLTSPALDLGSAASTYFRWPTANSDSSS